MNIILVYSTDVFLNVLLTWLYFSWTAVFFHYHYLAHKYLGLKAIDTIDGVYA